MAASRGGVNLLHLQMGNDFTRERAFVAALYLRNRLGLREKELKPWGKMPSDRMRWIARDIRAVESRLGGITPLDLQKHHQCVIKHWRDLEKGLRTGDYPDWVPTHFSNIARDLSIMANKCGLPRLELQSEEKNHADRGQLVMAPEHQGEFVMTEEDEDDSDDGEDDYDWHSHEEEGDDQVDDQEVDGEEEQEEDEEEEEGEEEGDEDEDSSDWLNQAHITSSSNQPVSAPAAAPAPGVNHFRPILQLFNVPQIQPSLPASGPYQSLSIEFFVHFFKDPPNVDTLLRFIRPPPASMGGKCW